MTPRKRAKHAHDLAYALEPLAIRLRAGGSLADAVAVRQMEIAIHEELLPFDDWVGVSMIAGSRCELAEDQLALGRGEDAIATSELALRDWNRVRDEHANCVLGVGWSLNVVSRSHGAAGHWEAALRAAEEADQVRAASTGD